MSKSPFPKTIHVIAGPTASGKSALALSWALEHNGIILNADSRQIYEGLPILSAQPGEDDLSLVPHRLYGVLHPNDACSAGRWVSMVRPLIEECFENAQTPIVTGGTGLYLKALIEGLSPIPSIPADMRACAVQRQSEMGNPAFYEELKRRDPKTAARYHPMHTARLIHAWEVLEATGTPLADWQDMPKDAPPADWIFDITLVIPDRGKLYERCNTRFVQMLDMGAIEELERFDARVESGEVSTTSILIKTIGAPALRAYRAGEISKQDAIEKGQTETRQYAKRQLTWFRNQMDAIQPPHTLKTISSTAT